MPKPSKPRRRVFGIPASGAMPESIGQYRIREHIGSGGMGDVWLGEDRFGSPVAIKQLSPGRLGQEKFVKRFLREGHVLARLRHPNICHIRSIENWDGLPFIAMEYVEGVSLSRLLRFLSSSTSTGDTAITRDGENEDISRIVNQLTRSGDTVDDESMPRDEPEGPLVTIPLEQSLSIGVKLCDAVQYAHERGVFHRDIKPSNVMIRSDGEPVLLDFGVAKIVGDQVREHLTITGQLFGTIEYMAPEQAQSGKDVDERADVYSLGAVLYEMITGHRHFVPTQSLVGDIDRLLEHESPPPSTYQKGVEPELDAIIGKALHPDQRIRYRSAVQFRQDLERYQKGEPVAARRPGPAYRVRRFLRKYALASVLGAAVLLVGLSFGSYMAWSHFREWGRWVEVYHEDFTDGAYDRTAIELEQPRGTELYRWKHDSTGLTFALGTWCWFTGATVPGDVRLVFEAVHTQQTDGVEAMVNAAADTVNPWYFMPRGYGCQIGGYDGTLDFVYTLKRPDMARVIAPGPGRVRRGVPFTVVLERQGTTVRLWVDGQLQAHTEDALPFRGPEFSRVGIRTYATGLKLLSASIYHMSLPERTTPLVVSEALVSLGHFDEAIATYLTVARDFAGSSLEEDALAGVLLAAYQQSTVENRELLDSVQSVFQARYRESRLWRVVQEQRMEQMWREGWFEDVLLMLPEHFRHYPSTRVALALQAIGAPAGYRDDLLKWVCRSEEVSAVDAAGLTDDELTALEGAAITNLRVNRSSITSLAPLQGMQLQWLVCSMNGIEDLSPVTGQPIRYLNASFNHIASCAPLAGAPLMTLHMQANRLTSIEHLAGAAIEYLDIGDNDLSDLSPLTGMPLWHLECPDNHISSLEPLRGAPMTYLDCAGNDIDDFGVLRSLPLTFLNCSRNKGIDLSVLEGLQLSLLRAAEMGIRDLSPVRDLPLENIELWGNPVSDLRPLAGSPVRVLALNHCSLSTLEGVQDLPNIRRLAANDNQLTSLAPLRGLQLERLAVQDNPLTSLSPVAENPPADMLFMCRSLPRDELERVAAVWDRTPESAWLAEQARICIAMNEGDLGRLKSMGVVHEGNRYLLFPYMCTWPVADSLSRAAGGHLVTIGDAEEEAFVRRLLEPVGFVWTGLHSDQNRTRWVTGEPITHLRGDIGNWLPGGWAYQRSIVPFGEYSESCFIVEWE